MSNRWLGICAAITLPLLSMGCGATSGFLRDSMTQTQVQGAGFRIVTTGLTSKVQTGAILCAIPAGDYDLYRRAMEELNAQAKLLPNQMLVNLREDHKTVGYLMFYCQHSLTLSADVIEFGDGSAAPPPPADEAPEAAPSPAEEAAPAATAPVAQPTTATPVAAAAAPAEPAAATTPKRRKAAPAQPQQ